MSMDLWFTVLNRLSLGLPMYLVYGVGFVLALSRWQRHPRVSFWTALGIAMLFLNRVFMTIVHASLPRLWHEWNMTGQQLSIWFMGLGFLDSLVAACAWGFVLAAIFSGRQVPAWLLASPLPPRPPEDEETAYRGEKPH